MGEFVVYPVKFAPIPKERIWGGNRLKPMFENQGDAKIGEYWVLSGHPNGTSRVTNGSFAGMTLVELTEKFPEAYLGQSPQGRFPLLIKFLEASTDLSVQIHPDDAYAKAHEGDFGKTEAWYILDCKPDGTVNHGHNFKTKEEYFAAVKEHRVRDYLRYLPIAKGQLVFVPSRTLHALLAGTIVIEVQQTSDVTYRVYDWDRVDATGKCRELHVAKAADVLTYDGHAVGSSAATASDGNSASLAAQSDSAAAAMHDGAIIPPDAAVTLPDASGHEAQLPYERLIHCPYFTIDKFSVSGSAVKVSLGHAGNPDVLIVAEGSLLLRYGEAAEEITLREGDTVLVPATLSDYQLETGSTATLLRVFY